MDTFGLEESLTALAPVLRGRHAIVTGGSRGIGLATAKYLAAMGADISILARDLATLAPCKDEISGTASAKVFAAVADVTDVDEVASAIDESVAQLGPPTILVNNAGAAVSAPFSKTDAGLLQSMLDVNLIGAFHCTHRVLPAMIETGFGRIVNIASTAGLVGYRYTSAYCAAKHAVIGLTRSLALEVARTGVTVNAICPGFTATDIVADAVRNITERTGKSAAEATASLTAVNPQGRLVRPNEVAAAVGWLCLPESAAVNGQSIRVDGGEVM